MHIAMLAVPLLFLWSIVANACDQSPLVVAHRGSTLDHPENTLSAFAWANAIGADLIELDVRFSADGYPVVMHDARVDRTTDGRGSVAEMKLAQLQELDAGDSQGVPTLEAALAFSERTQTRLLLDIKDERPNVHALAEVIRGFSHIPAVTVGLHSADALAALNREPVRLTTLAFAPEAGQIDQFLEHGVHGVRLWARWLRRQPELVADVRSAGACVWVTTGRLRGPRLARIMTLDVGGLITDHPAHALALRASLAAP